MKQGIPERYLNEFLEELKTLMKSRIWLSCWLFVIAVIATSSANIIVSSREFNVDVAVTWILVIAGCVVIAFLNNRAKSIKATKFVAALFIIMILFIVTRHLIAVGLHIYMALIVYLCLIFGVSLTMPWFPKAIVGISGLHLAAFTYYFSVISKEIYKDFGLYTDRSDYFQGLVMLLLASVISFVAPRRESRRQIDNFTLLKKIESNNKQMQKELELATRVHRRLIPKSVSTDLADIDVAYLPVYYMGGDYAKFHFIDKDKLIFIICDVTGHGVSAALLVNALHTEFERLTKKGQTPGVLLKELNDFIVKDFAETNMFLTAFCGLLDYASMRLTYSNYGHPAQYIYRVTDSDVQHLRSQASLLGLSATDSNIYQNEIIFDKGDQILLFTDGVIEATNKDNQQYGEGRLEDFIKQNHKLQPALFNQRLLDELNAFKDKNFTDDVFLLSIKTK